MLSRRDGVALWGIHHKHASLRRSRDIHVVDSDPGPTHNAEFVGGRDHIGGHLRAGADHQGVVFTDDRFQLFWAETGALIDLSHLAQDVDAGLINGVGNQNFCHQPAKDCRGPL